MSQQLFIPGQAVSFKIKDAVCPKLADALAAIGPELEVRGEIAFFSDGGEQRRHFAIVEVEGIHRPLIVPVERLEAAAGSWDGSKRRDVADASSRQVC